MIATVAGWLYIIQALLGLASLKASPLGFGMSGQLGTVALSVAFGAVGVGLLKRLPGARWPALGLSFLGWTLGSLFTVGLLIVGLWAMASFGGFGMIIFFVLLFSIAMGVVGVVISYKLYSFLRSDEGVLEFDGPDTEGFGTVLLSAGAWIGAAIVSSMMSFGSITSSSGSLFGSNDNERAMREFNDQMRVDSERRAADRREAERREAERNETPRERAMRLEKERLESEGSSQYVPPVHDGQRTPSPSIQTQTQVQTPTIEESPAPNTSALLQPEEEKKIDTKRILKCRDSSGGIQFTQGYCPPGTKEVATPTE